MATLAELLAGIGKESKESKETKESKESSLLPIKTMNTLLAQSITADKISVTPLSNLDQVRDKITDLQNRLQQNLPGYESLLFYIHRYLAEDKEAAFVLSEEEIGTIVRGLTKRKGIVLAESIQKGNKTISGKALKDIGMDDI